MANETVKTLCNAARAGDLDRVREIIAAEPQLAYQEMADNNEHQAIHFAAEAGNAEVVNEPKVPCRGGICVARLFPKTPSVPSGGFAWMFLQHL